MPHYKLAVGRFPYGGIEHSECVDWLIDTSSKLARDPRFSVCWLKENDTPITMTRNKMFRDTIQMGADLLLIVDSDMAPDCELRFDPHAKPFLESSLDFVVNHPGPCVIAAPYCGPPPHENIYVFEWKNKETGVPVESSGLKLDQFSREQAAMMRGITEVAALPTGLMLIDVRALAKLPVPHTYYDFENDGPACPGCKRKAPGPQAVKASTEDVTFTRDLSNMGVPVYCNWDAWAGHVKKKIVRKPRPYTADMVNAKMREAVVRGTELGETIREIKANGRFAADIARAMREHNAARAEAERTGDWRQAGLISPDGELPPGLRGVPAAEAHFAYQKLIHTAVADRLQTEQGFQATSTSPPLTVADLLRG